ncbi:hypothetical protein DUNSADRAFT_14560 [Dunaliella salina]|uniref:Encoded protein n=1 Tax=Dunaliella salina TaxID=3046 RepID=A0ABQ7G750_DUNSA|nr:hypothetical protein DUNSADRAFT_14560 [Dunaliella salina]|eukprot:KAF5830442.1 hypothetical protein DUNSADRAFT_14560 [Dunaliella salina]
MGCSLLVSCSCTPESHRSLNERLRHMNESAERVDADPRLQFLLVWSFTIYSWDGNPQSSTNKLFANNSWHGLKESKACVWSSSLLTRRMRNPMNFMQTIAMCT